MGYPRLSVVAVVVVPPVYIASLLGRPAIQSLKLRRPDGFEFRGWNTHQLHSQCLDDLRGCAVQFGYTMSPDPPAGLQSGTDEIHEEM